VKHGVRARIFIANNGSYGTIRMHQERAYPGRPAATDLVNPDFAKLAEAFGARGLVVAHERDVAGAVDKALAHDGPVVVDMRTSIEQISAFASLQEIAGR
jgi:acetolactate synthase-1/2/3 large subunit